MANSGSKGGRPVGRPPKPKMKSAKIIVNEMNVRINGITYNGREGDKLSMVDWVYDKLMNQGFVK